MMMATVFWISKTIIRSILLSLTRQMLMRMDGHRNRILTIMMIPCPRLVLWTPILMVLQIAVGLRPTRMMTVMALSTLMMRFH